MEHPYLYGDWVEDALTDLYLLRELTNMCYHRLSNGQAVPQGTLDRMSDLANKLQREFDPQLAEVGNGEA